jgi:hypothetical protein
MMDGGVIAFGLGATAAIAILLGLALALLRSGRATALDLARGVRSGSLIALGLLVVVAGGFTLLTVGQPFLFGATVSPEGALAVGLLAGAAIAVTYLAIGLLVMLVGLFARPGPRWVTRSAWLVTPVVGVLGMSAFGFAASLGEYADRPITRAGTVSVSIDGGAMGRVQAHGQARCVLEDDTNLAVQAGAGEGGTLESADGRPVAVQLGLIGEVQPMLAIDVGQLAASDSRSPAASLTLASGADRYGGTLEFRGLTPRDPALTAPLEGEAWQGTVTWQCWF